ncbi:MAG: hypothetical protein GXO45_04430 [Aquificae bacterium]|nr:hypothetical protein [Aquificota bacterium]
MQNTDRNLQILIFKGHPDKVETQVAPVFEIDNSETYMEVPFEFYLDLPEEEKAFIEGFNKYIDGDLKGSRRELAKSTNKIPEAKYMFALVSLVLGKPREAQFVLADFKPEWKRFIQTWRVPVLVVPFATGEKALYIAPDEKGLQAINHLLDGKSPEEIAFLLGL